MCRLLADGRSIGGICLLFGSASEEEAKSCLRVCMQRPYYGPTQANGERRWIKWFKRPRLQASLKSEENARAGSRSGCTASGPDENGMVSCEDQVSLDQIWRTYFKDRTEAWDDKQNKTPDIEHTNSQETLWTDSCDTPKWVRRSVERKTPLKKAGGDSIGSATSFNGGTGNAGESQPNQNSWSAQITQYTMCGQGRQALKGYNELQESGVKLSPENFVAALRASSSLRDLESVKRIHTDVVNSGFESIVSVGNTLVDVYAKCGSLLDARHVFERMPCRTVVSWNAIIFGYAQMEDGEEAFQLYTRMKQEGAAANRQTFLGALKACRSLMATEDGNVLRGIQVKTRCLEQVRAIHSQVMERGYHLDIYVGAKLVDVYAKCGSLVDARAIFEEMPHRDVVTWNAMILGYAQMEEGGQALQLYTRMQQEGVVPNERTFVGALQACGSLAGLEKGKEIHAQILKAGLGTIDHFLPTSLIDMYSKCGSMEDAQQLFDALPTKNIVTSSALIAGYARIGESDLVFEIFEKMRQEGIQPNGITFLSVLAVCSHVGLVNKGQEYFEAMSGDYGITPRIEHYNCMVDLLGRAGRVVEAMEMVKNMPFDPPGRVWRCLLGACRKWGNVELGRQAFEAAVGVDNNDASAYVLMSNTYAAAHMLDKAKELHKRRVNARAWKQPGQSRWTDKSGIVHTFGVGDRDHPESPDVHAKMRDLLYRMKRAGYVPHLESVLRDIPDDEKEDALCEHSEKLAIAYALLKTTEGTTIRVVKNLRVCEDCHAAIAVISKIEKRTLICRDASRFHVYKEGKCSCRDYW